MLVLAIVLELKLLRIEHEHEWGPEQKPFVIWGRPATFPARERPMAPRRSDHLAPQSGTESANEVGQILTKEQFAERGIPLLRDKTTCQEQLTPRPAGSDANAF